MQVAAAALLVSQRFAVAAPPDAETQVAVAVLAACCSAGFAVG